MPTHRRALGYVFQETRLFAHLDVRRNLEYGMKRVAAAQRRVSLAQAVELLGIGHLLARRPDTLSGGERQRVGIARALATSPRLLLMDEPLASLDLQRKREILPYLERLHAELDIPVIYVSHAADEVARLADHLVLMEAGRVLASGPANALMTRLDLPLAHGDAAGAIIDGDRRRASMRAFGLTQLAFAGGTLWLPHGGTRIGQAVRVRIQARDVSLTLHAAGGHQRAQHPAGDRDRSRATTARRRSWWGWTPAARACWRASRASRPRCCAFARARPCMRRSRASRSSSEDHAPTGTLSRKPVTARSLPDSSCTKSVPSTRSSAPLGPRVHEKRRCSPCASAWPLSLKRKPG